MKHADGHTVVRGYESRPARGAWIETVAFCGLATAQTSRPARGAWIETETVSYPTLTLGVAPRAGRVD